MIHQGDVIENEVTGERLVFVKTSQETNGELVVVEAFVKPTGFVASAHLHPYQEERFGVLSGEVGFKLDKSRLIAGPGERVTVPAGRRTSSGAAGAQGLMGTPVLRVSRREGAQGNQRDKGAKLATR
jgi:quercetin dioxygenase-like cupin family protein